jgi:TPR repeat protein
MIKEFYLMSSSRKTFTLLSLIVLSMVAYFQKASAMNALEDKDEFWNIYGPSFPDKSLSDFELLLEQNDPKALCFLGRAYWKGHGVNPNRKKSLEYYALAAKYGDDSDKQFYARIQTITEKEFNDQWTDPQWWAKQ